ncbi:hypothetical protein MRX96_032807 [Rhipicephalus microplus]
METKEGSQMCPPKAKLHFNVELLDTYPAKDESDLPFQERLSIGDAKRERGNFWYSRGDYSNAAHCYRRALDFLDDMGLNLSESPADLQLLLDTRLKVYNNLTATQMKMKAYDAALKSVDFVLKVQPNNVKALYRKGKILADQGNYSEAVSVLKKALKLEPDTKIIQQELSRLMWHKERQDRVERAMYKRMFGGSNSSDSKESSKGSRFQQEGYIADVTEIVVKFSKLPQAVSYCGALNELRMAVLRTQIRNWTLVLGSAAVAAAAVGIAAYRHLGAM